MKNIKSILVVFFTTIISMSFLHAQNSQCEPTKIMTTDEGTVVKYYGGEVRKYKIVSDDKSSYDLYIVQYEDGAKGTFLLSVFSESVQNPSLYEYAVNNYLNQQNLKNSSLKLQVGGKSIIFSPISCTQSPKKLMGSVSSYTVIFLAEISKEQVQQLQDSDLEYFELNLGGKPYFTRFKKANNVTKTIKESFGCIDLESIMEIQEKSAEELNMDEVPMSEYKNRIIGNWITTNDSGQKIIMRVYEKSYTLEMMNSVFYEGTYKILKDRFIFSGDQGSSTSKIVLFLEDMVVIDNKGVEATWTRI